jgi:hypothetical protein
MGRSKRRPGALDFPNSNEAHTPEAPLLASVFGRSSTREMQWEPYGHAVLGILSFQWENRKNGVSTSLKSLMQILGILGILVWEFWEKSNFVNADGTAVIIKLGC